MEVQSFSPDDGNQSDYHACQPPFITFEHLQPVSSRSTLHLVGPAAENVYQYRSFSFYSERPLIIGLMVSSSLMTPLDTILSFVMNAISRRHEFQADLFAYKLSDASHPYADKLKSALVRLGNENKSVTEVDSLWSAYKHSHPVGFSPRSGWPS